MARAWRKKGMSARRAIALQNLRDSKFFEKNGRSQDSWQERKDREIKILERRL